MSTVDDIEKLHTLRSSGAISEEEYQEAKQALLPKLQTEVTVPAGATLTTPAKVNEWAMLLHLSQFAGFLVPMAGLAAPIVMWQMKKDESEIIDQHGKNVVNWIVTELIAGITFFVLSFVVIGIPLLIALGVVGLIFPIVGGIKASNGEIWPYPLSIKFFK